jgi:hypothetical protein
MHPALGIPGKQQMCALAMQCLVIVPVEALGKVGAVQFRAMMQAMDAGADLSSLRAAVSAGETLPAPVYEAWQEKTGKPFAFPAGPDSWRGHVRSLAGSELRGVPSRDAAGAAGGEGSIRLGGGPVTWG